MSHHIEVLIIDIDYHCGNGTYQSLKNDDRFLFVNFHAYHYGASWPFDSEYDYDSSGKNIIKHSHLDKILENFAFKKVE